MAQGNHNHFHYDHCVGRGTPNRYTMWSALTEIDLTGGAMVIRLKSHQHQKLISTYGATDMDRDLTGAVFSINPQDMVEDFGFTLAAHFQPGDIIIFGMYMMHSTAPNLTDSYHISIDTRYQLADKAKDDAFSSGQTVPGPATSIISVRPIRRQLNSASSGASIK